MTIAKIIERAINDNSKRGLSTEAICQHAEHEIRLSLGHFSKEGLTFGQATDAAKQGQKVARQGWNGSGMFAYIVPAASYPAQTEAAKKQFGDMVPYRAYWALKTAQNDVATWAPSGSDSLAEDWMIID